MERHFRLLLLVLALVATTTTAAEPEASRCVREGTATTYAAGPYTGKASAGATSPCAEVDTGKSSALSTTRAEADTGKSSAVTGTSTARSTTRSAAGTFTTTRAEDDSGKSSAFSSTRAATGTSTTTGVEAKEIEGTAAVKTPAGGDHAIKDLAREMALFCRRRSHASCCDPLVAYVNFAGICRVASEPQLILARLNASRLLALYGACGGEQQNPNSPCQDEVSPPAILVAGSKLSAGEPICDSYLMARALTSSCNVDSSMPSPQCCRYVLMTIDGDGQCLCSVIDDGRFALSRLDVSFMWSAYKLCGGNRQAVPNDVTRCHHAPSPPPPPAAPAPSAHGKLSPWAILGIVLACIVVVAAMATAALKLYTLFKAPVEIAHPPHADVPVDSLPVEQPQGASSVQLPQETDEALEEDGLQESESKQSPAAELQLVQPTVKAPSTGPPPPLPKPTPPPPPPELPNPINPKPILPPAVPAPIPVS